MSRRADPLRDAVAAFVAGAWLGMLLGVSFLATPVKFQAPWPDLPVALEVGRVTFAVFARVEWGLALLLGIAVVPPRRPRAQILVAAVAILIVVLQTLWLLPVLDVRVEAVIAGRPMPSSIHHLLYAGMEAVKASALASVALVGLFRLGWRNRPEAAAECP